MDWKISYAKYSQAGNTTLLVLDPIPQSQHSALARRILSADHSVEQIGFVTDATTPVAAARLRMMGGEFCANATCATAWHLAKTCPNQSLGIEINDAGEVVRAHVSGAVVELALPVRRSADSVRRIGEETLVSLRGITHLITERKPGHDIGSDAHRLLCAWRLHSLRAAGVIYCLRSHQEIAITPVIAVRDTASVVRETACASGSGCVAISEAVRRQREVVLDVIQPSGETITASAYLAAHRTYAHRATVSVEIKLLDEGTMVVQ